MKTSDFYFELPKGLIAQTPLDRRDHSRLLIYDRSDKSIKDDRFFSLPSYLKAGDVLVRNTTKVIPARLFGVNEQTGGSMEFLLLKRIEGDVWESLVKPGRRAKLGARYIVDGEIIIEILDKAESGGRIVKLIYQGIFEEVLDRVGNAPLPPYITERLNDKWRYQTIYAKEWGSAAAPTAGLHFTDDILKQIEDMGVGIADILLHVGLGTFRPVSAQNVEEHIMHSEYYEVGERAAELISTAKANGGRVIAVGTTVCRTLESVVKCYGGIRPCSGSTDIFITPGYEFKVVDALITNFHLPESTLLMLVSAFAGREEMLRAYAHAIENGYRFFSFGDASLIL